jgi:hypothetical protein
MSSYGVDVWYIFSRTHDKYELILVSWVVLYTLVTISCRCRVSIYFPPHTAGLVGRHPLRFEPRPFCIFDASQSRIRACES